MTTATIGTDKTGQFPGPAFGCEGTAPTEDPFYYQNYGWNRPSPSSFGALNQTTAGYSNAFSPLAQPRAPSQITPQSYNPTSMCFSPASTTSENAFLAHPGQQANLPTYQQSYAYQNQFNPTLTTLRSFAVGNTQQGLSPSPIINVANKTDAGSARYNSTCLFGPNVGSI